VSQRIVVIFRGQDISIEDQKILGQKLGQLSGKPSTSGLHIHPVVRSGAPGSDDEISVINTSQLYPPRASEN
jgi:hypothetical protein